ncbi:retroviral-like aspartic protease family protein [Qipengyuania flava]|uniref:retroviral-like aspartic protease family protein n=1 Tax=Qipengyuania flava TaxID=192812 RepID=UPI001C63843D|nr:retroviral-like aspartic protease family protein [Qipengyuania flava]QYJ06818.1 aspartyl protease family protein [Qipengyuania flava]
MIRTKLLAGMLALTASPASATPSEIAEPAMTSEEAALARDRYERMTVPVTIDGSKPYRFLIDTGAQATVVTHRIVEELNLQRRGQAMLVAMGSQELVDLVEVDELSFADQSITGLIAPLLRANNIGADGILGLDSLQDLRVLIDFREERMLVADADALGGNSGYEIVVRARRKLGQMVITDANINGVRTAVVIDTGAQNSIGNLALFRKLRAREVGEMTSTDVHGTLVRSDLSYARELEIGGMTMGNVPIGFTESPTFDALDLTNRPALILGIGNMRVFDRVAIDFARRQVLFDIPGRRDPSRARAMFRGGWLGTP